VRGAEAGLKAINMELAEKTTYKRAPPISRRRWRA